MKNSNPGKTKSCLETNETNFLSSNNKIFNGDVAAHYG